MLYLLGALTRGSQISSLKGETSLGLFLLVDKLCDAVSSSATSADLEDLPLCLPMVDVDGSAGSDQDVDAGVSALSSTFRAKRLLPDIDFPPEPDNVPGVLNVSNSSILRNPSHVCFAFNLWRATFALRHLIKESSAFF